ncbi:unnamed protein product [Menidia menidia]|uniref:(Atlantic silverside) hypothetical protein n=1 Tax=Menidia menidia TaxID=238744 RepID=A0A8S4BCL9_9TELE|nr:unnamed protein product [Menidia menidia]
MFVSPGSYSVKGSPERVQVPLGGDAHLPCRLHPASDVRSLTVLWELNGTQVYSYRSKSPSSDVDARFMDRTSLNDTDMSSGNISLTLHNITEEDEGMYTCIVPRRFKATVTLVVGYSKGLFVSPGKYSVNGSPKRVVVPLGGDALLPCHLHPASDVRSLTVLWEFNGTQVYSYRSKSPSSDVDARFMNRTSLNDTDMSSGNISLTLHNITEEDEGMYTCIVPRRFKATVHVAVGEFC